MYVSIKELKKIKCYPCKGEGTIFQDGGLMGDYWEKCKECKGTGIHPQVLKLIKK